MAKIAQLKQANEQVFPQTITPAIAVVGKAKLLSEYLTALEGSLGQDETYAANSNATYISGATSMNNADVILDTELKKVADQVAANTIVANDKSVVVAPITSGDDSGKTGINVNIKSGEGVIKLDSNGNGGIYTDLDLVKITNGLPATVKERYQLLDSNDTQIGVNIDVAKDSHIVSINYISGSTDPHYQNLEYVYIDASGVTQTTYVDMSQLVLEAEFASGITITNHIAHGVVDSTSEKDSQETPAAFLTVGADGFKVSGIKDEIDRKINALDASVSGQNNSVKVTVVEADGKLTSTTVEVTDASVTFDDETSGLTIDGNSTDIVTKAGADAIKSYVDAKTGALDSNVTGQTTDGFIKVEVDQVNGALNYVHVTGTTQAVASADDSNKGLAEASDVKEYVDGQIESLDANVSGENGAVKVQVVEANGVITNVNVTATTANMADAGLTGTELAKTKDVKDYVDSAATKNTIIDSADIDATVAATGTTLAIKYGAITSDGARAVSGATIYDYSVTVDSFGTEYTGTWPNIEVKGQ